MSTELWVIAQSSIKTVTKVLSAVDMGWWQALLITLILTAGTVLTAWFSYRKGVRTSQIEADQDEEDRKNTHSQALLDKQRELLEQLSNENSKLRSRIDDLQSESEQHISRLQEESDVEMTDLEDAREALKDELHEKEAENARLRDQLEKRERRVEEQQNVIHHLARQNQGLRRVAREYRQSEDGDHLEPIDSQFPPVLDESDSES